MAVYIGDGRSDAPLIWSAALFGAPSSANGLVLGWSMNFSVHDAAQTPGFAFPHVARGITARASETAIAVQAATVACSVLLS
jgi:hypothetical protein